MRRFSECSIVRLRCYNNFLIITKKLIDSDIGECTLVIKQFIEADNQRIVTTRSCSHAYNQ